MLTKNMIIKIKEKIDNMLSEKLNPLNWTNEKELVKYGYLGSGIHRYTFILDDSYVMKVEKEVPMTKAHKEDASRYSPGLRFALMNQLKEKKITNKEYLDFISLFLIEASEESIDYFLLKKRYIGQNYTEALNWRVVQTAEISKMIVPVYGIVKYRNFTIIVQDRGKKCENCGSTFNLRQTITVELRKLGFKVDDLHGNNIISMPNGELKICDTGLCKFRNY